MNINASLHKQVYALWDRLADFSATEIDAALDYLTQALCALVNARGADWVGTARRSGGPHTNFPDSGDGDVIRIGVPVGDASESRFAIFRDHNRPPFGFREHDRVAYVLCGIKWFHRQLLLSHGLLVAETPLTPVERRVLKQLLGGLAEKQIATEIGQSYHTTHGYVSALYRKFGVNNRPTLMALWLGAGA